jgi:formylglycine-generating enzyme required for sulfatase activity
MGSLGEEPDRYTDEGHRHRVRLTQGFWLADTACSQVLWLPVMGGENPSKFQDDAQNPVEQVSWDDVQGFVVRLTELAADEGAQAVLPTEAQWEYACRAGTETAFNLGPSISTAQVNFSGKWEYDDKKTTLGEGRGKTLPVRSFAPNA